MRPLSIQILALFAAFLGACGPIGKGIDPNDSDSTYHTGAGLELIGTGDSVADTHVPYTISGGSDDFNVLREELYDNTDIDLAKRVFSVDVQTLSRDGSATLINPETIKVTVILNSTTTNSNPPIETLTFAGALSVDGENLVAKNLLFEDFQLSTSCRKTKCDTVSLRLTPKSGKTVGILYRVTQPKIRIESGDTADFRSATLNQLKQNAKSIDGKRVSVSVLQGPSYTTIEIPAENMNSSSATPPTPQAQPALQLRTSLLDTRDLRTEIRDVKFSGATVPTISASLVGNDPSSGSVLLDLESTDTQEKARLIVEEPAAPEIEKPKATEPKPEVPVKTPQSRPAQKDPQPQTQPQTQPQPHQDAMPVQPEVGIFSPTLDAELKPNVAHTTKAFSLYARDPETQRMMRVWQGLEKNSGACARGTFGSRRLVNYVRLAPNVSEIVKSITEEIDVTPEIAYILAIESNFLNQDTYPTKEARKYKNKAGRYVLAGDLGPWQIVYGTASFINNNLFNGTFRIFDITRDSSKIAADDRTYFEQATYMAALYFRYLFAQFKYDPGVAVLAYHAGPGDAGKFVRYADGKTGIDSKKRESFVEDLAHFRTSLSDIRRYRIQSNKVCAQINYAYAFLGVRTLGQNLAQHSVNIGTEKAPKMVPLSDIQRSDSKLFTERLSRKGGPLPQTERKP